jgi:tetratricopeptide (TPR) repeat protein
VSAVAAGLAFALHPLRVEPVAWASAQPYLLALAPLLGCVLAYLESVARSRRGAWLGASVALYGVALLCRAAAPGLPVVLLVIDAFLGRLRRGWRGAVLEKLPFAAVALAATLAEAGARRFAPLEQVALSARLADAALAPFLYLWRTLWPVSLTPLDPQPLEAGGSSAWLVAAAALLLLATGIAVRLRAKWPSLLAGWLAYLALVAPASGLAPSGLQATADRYTYLPGVVLALLAGGLVGLAWSAPAWRAPLAASAAVVALAMSLASARYLRSWRDSVTLWTRALAVDARNDVALYNLALALEENGDEQAAVQRYEGLLRLLPDHAPARHNRDRLLARRYEREAGELATAGRLEDAVEAYGRALALDPKRLHSRRSRGMALAQLGRFEEAIPDLREAVVAGPPEPPVLQALAFALQRAGRPDEAQALLAAAPAPRPTPR